MQYPSGPNDQELADAFIEFFITTIKRFVLNYWLVWVLSFLILILKLLAPRALMVLIRSPTEEVVLKLISRSTVKAYSLDPLPATIMLECYGTLAPIKLD